MRCLDVFLGCGETNLIKLLVTPEPEMITNSVFGWIVIQQQMAVNPAYSWNASWTTYKEGFGKVGTNFWLGLERIHLLTSRHAYRLRVELKSDQTGL